MDEIDEAQERSQLFLNQALNRHFGRAEHRGNGPEARRDRSVSPGVCSDCGDEIDANRMEANPHAIRCLDCQEKYERRKRLGAF